MDQTLESKIKQLKGQLNAAQKASQLWGALTEKREILESQIAELICEIENNRNIGYRKPLNDASLQRAIESKEEILKGIKSDKQLIDEKLDELEGVSKEIINGLKNQLIAAILEKNPEERAGYKRWELDCNNCEKFARELRELSELTKGIIKLNSHVIEEAQQPKHFLLLNFFLGRSRRITIQKHLHNLQIICGKTLDSLRNTLKLAGEKSFVSIQLEELQEAIIQLKRIAENRWNSKIVELYLIPLNKKIKSQQNSLAQLQEKFKEEARKIRGRIDQWIEKST